jgi:hypothetical protein
MQTTHYFTNCLTLAALTKERNRLARIHHPDVGGSVEVMQAINAQFDQAKKRLSTPGRERVYVRPQQPETAADMLSKFWEDVLRKQQEQARQWAEDVKRQQQEQWGQDRQAYRDQVDRQQQRLKEELNWALEQCRKAQGQGLLRGCQLYTDRMHTTLNVGGSNTYHYRQWFKDHGFRWNAEKRQWYFHKKPLFNPDEEDDCDDEYEPEDIPR